MRASEFITETATSGATASGSVATVVKPLTKKKKGGKSFFGAETDDFPAYGETSVIRRSSPISNKK